MATANAIQEDFSVKNVRANALGKKDTDADSPALEEAERVLEKA
mgnify:CR=1 FL=1